jgi:membrane-associated HD superfamily phosphohydrolase
MKRVEFLLFVLAALSVLMRYNNIPGARYLILFSGIVLMTFYLITGIGITRRTFFLTAMTYHAHGMRPVFYTRALGGITFAYSLFAFYLHEFYKPYRDLNGILAALLLTIVMFAALAAIEKRDPELSKSLLFRSAIASVILMFYTLTPIKTRLSWEFDDQYYREILEYSIMNPGDEEARKEVETYERRLEGLSPKEDQGVDETQ